MLVRAYEDDGVLAIGQASHAWLSGQVARAWGNERFGELVPREEVCLAAEQHDVGMSLWDTAPTLNPDTGLPHSFMEMAIETHLALWSRAPGRLLTQSRYAALLVSMHGTALYERRNLERLEPVQADAVRRYLSEQRGLQRELLRQLRSDHGEAEAAAARNQKLLFAWDWLSLALCLDWAPDSHRDVPTAGDPAELRLEPAAAGALSLEPWPFREKRVQVFAEGRILRERFSDEGAMHAALAQAPWTTLRFELASGNADAGRAQ